MTISVWRYSHLTLAVSSFLFIALASLTGIILAFDAVDTRLPPYRTEGLEQISLAASVPTLSKVYPEVSEITVDHNQFVTVKGIDSAGENALAYVDAKSGVLLGIPKPKSEFIEWTTALHRSLFLHEAGRFFVGLTCFLLLLIAISGTVLIIKRQRGVKRFFKKIAKEHFAQYYHVVLGRLSLIVIIIIAVSGTFLSLERFGLLPAKKVVHKADFGKISTVAKMSPANFPAFSNILLSEVEKIEFPFSDDPEDYFLVKLRDREVIVDQFTGKVISDQKYPMSSFFTTLSLDLHTGRSSILWAIILGAACINILFFIYSGFVITWRRIRGKVKNRFKPEDSQYIILFGSENGSTRQFANMLHQQLLKHGRKSFITGLDNYGLFPAASHLVIVTATYGLGDPPSNAKKFLGLIEKYPQKQNIDFSVLAFGSHAYPDFCRYGYDIHNALSAKEWAKPLIEIHTVNDKSTEQFMQWFSVWAGHAGLPLTGMDAVAGLKPDGLKTMRVISKTFIEQGEGAFLLQLKPGMLAKFESGDLLAVYPANDHRERLYSIGKIGKDIQLSVRMYNGGLGSTYLYQLNPGDELRAKLVRHDEFHFPKKTAAVLMICNGTGIAPFLGMIDQNTAKVECHLYCGFRSASSFELYSGILSLSADQQKLARLHIAYSREGDRQYVSDLIRRDSDYIASVLAKGGVLMICGSLSMEKDVNELLEKICFEKNAQRLSYYQSRGQILSDCY